MQRPVPSKKLGRSWLIRAYGFTWRVKRFTRWGPLVVVDWWYQRLMLSTPKRRADLVRSLTMIKPNGAVSKGTMKLATDDPKAWEGFPHLRGFFLDQTYGADESERSPGLMILRASSDGWQWTLKEITQCLMLRFSSRTFEEGILLAEGFLGDKAGPWETDPYESAKRGRSRKPKA